MKSLDLNKIGQTTLPNGRTLSDFVLEQWVRNIASGNQKAIADLMDRIEGRVSEEPPTTPDNPLVDALREIVDAAKREGEARDGKVKR